MWSQLAPWYTVEGRTGPRMENWGPGGRGYRVFLPCWSSPLQTPALRAAVAGGKETAKGGSPPSGRTDWTSHTPLLADFPFVGVKFLQSARQAPLFMKFSRPRMLECPPLGDVPNSGIEPASVMSPALAPRSLPLAPSQSLLPVRNSNFLNSI